jgi:EcoRII C terminal
MGYSLQNQLAALFDITGLRYEPQATTEGKNRPDFIFPGSREYQYQQFEASLLVMLGAKSTLKERWRQILTEAERIPTKHLCTLEPGISVDQTDEIKLRSVRLVIPESLHATYLSQQQQDIWTVRSFIDFVRQKQAST